jgi:mannosyltransferase
VRGTRLTLDCIVFGLQTRGGISNYWAKLLGYASQESSLSCEIILPKRVAFSEFDERLARIPAYVERINASVARYLPAVSRGEDAVFHTSYYRIPRGRVRKFVVSAYDFTYEHYRRGLARTVHSIQKGASLKRADVIVCISESTRRDVLEFYPGIDAQKLRTVPLGVDRELFFREDVAPSADERMVLFVGQRVGYKRFDIAISALEQTPALVLGIVGPQLSGDERVTLQRRLGARWRELGSVNNASLRRLYSSAFAFIFPSDYEGFGLPVLEAMACGCPVVAAARSSLPEVGGSAARYACRQDGEAYAAELIDLESTQVREAAISAGLSRVREFSWNRTFKETFATYLET